MNKFSIINKFFYFLLSLVFLIIPFYVQAEVTASGNIILPPLPDVPNTPTTPTTPLVPTTPPPYIDPTTSNVYSAAFDAIHYLYFGALVPTPDYAQLAKDVAAEDATIQAQNQGYGAGGTTGNTSGSGGNTSGSDGSTANPTAAQIQQMQNAGVGKQYSGTSAGINTSSLTGIYPDKVCTTDGTCTYKLLAPIGGFLGENGVYILKRNDSKSLCALLNSWFRIGIALAGLLAVVMIVIGGIQYATTDAMTDKSGGKEKIMNALWGLLLALTTYLILNTVNPALTNCEIQAKPVVLDNLTINSAALTASGNPYLGNPLTTDQAAMAAYFNSLPGGGGSIAKNAVAGITFPDQSWNSAALQEIQNSGILMLTPSDAAKFFPNGTPTAEGYVSLLASIAKSESAFNPNDNTTAHRKDGSSAFSSEGLLSLSVGDSAVQALAAQKGVSPQEIINNPITNIQAGVAILKNQVQSRGTITGGATTGYWGPLRRGE